MGDLSWTYSYCSGNGALPSSSADLSPSCFKVGRLVVKFVMAYLTILQLLIRSFVKSADCFACSFYGVQGKMFHFSEIDLADHGQKNREPVDFSGFLKAKIIYF